MSRNEKMIAEKKAPGFIQRGAMYTLAELQERLGLGAHAWRTARREGLPVRAIGGRKFALGSDVIEWVGSKTIDVNLN